jgi:hypothetical protein
MENEDDILDSNSIEQETSVEPQQIISTGKFVILSLLSFGLYAIWWMYKAWRFFKQKDQLDIMPAARAIFSIFFVYALFNEIMWFAKKKEYTLNYNAGWLASGFIILNLLSRVLNSFRLISLFSFIFLIPAFNALNFAKEKSTEFTVTQQQSFNQKQIVLMLIGLLLWILVILTF